MRPETLGFDEWPMRRAALRMGVCLWVLGFALGGAAAWRLHSVSSAPNEAIQTETFGRAPVMSDAPCTVAATDSQDNNDMATAEDLSPSGALAFAGEVFMPEDTVVGRRQPFLGATQMQK
jgi:hypothetical protein